MVPIDKRGRQKRAVVIASVVFASVLIAIIAAAALRGGRTPPSTHAIRGIDERGNLTTFRRTYKDILTEDTRLVRRLAIPYTANGGAGRTAYIVLPRWYGPRRHPPIPLVISPHGRGITATANLRFWRDLPAYGPFALVSPDGQGRRLELYSWGWKGQIDDLARMPNLITAALPGISSAATRSQPPGSREGRDRRHPNDGSTGLREP